MGRLIFQQSGSWERGGRLCAEKEATGIEGAADKDGGIGGKNGKGEAGETGIDKDRL